MKKHTLLLFTVVLILLTNRVHSQGCYWVAFSDKNNSEYSFNNPEIFLSQRALDRRLRQNIAIDSLDLPVNQWYIDSVLTLDAVLIHKSKWLNGITVKTENENFQKNVFNLPFVKNVQLTKPLTSTKSSFNKFKEQDNDLKESIDTSFYGPSVYQTGLLNGQFLHNQGFRGKDKHIAVLDAGFLNADIYAAFDSLWINEQILGTKDFVDPEQDIFKTHYHGMSVLSCMGGNVPGELIGTAIKASFWLLRTEDAASEYLIEEDNWVAAAEFADSAGVDIINSSLGYFEFDDPEMNHTYSDMNGNSTRVTRAANIAVKKGMLVFSSAGNEGNDSWKYIIAPSDGDYVMAVGATDSYGVAASFTSHGPASDGDVKPNIAAVGLNTYLQRSDGYLGYGSGTSFSSPVMAGMAACLWEAFPDATAQEIKQAVESSASLFNKPDSLLGFGIPDMKMAALILGSELTVEWEKDKNWIVYPNPVNDYLFIQYKEETAPRKFAIEILSLDGRLIRKWVNHGSSRYIISGLHSLPSGILLMRIQSENNSETVKLFKYR